MSAAISHSHRHRLVAAPAAIAFATWVAATTLAIDAASPGLKGRGSVRRRDVGTGLRCAFYSFEQCMASASGLWAHVPPIHCTFPTTTPGAPASPRPSSVMERAARRSGIAITEGRPRGQLLTPRGRNTTGQVPEGRWPGWRHILPPHPIRPLIRPSYCLMR
jgi:hypothetical protein